MRDVFAYNLEVCAERLCKRGIGETDVLGDIRAGQSDIRDTQRHVCRIGRAVERNYRVEREILRYTACRVVFAEVYVVVFESNSACHSVKRLRGNADGNRMRLRSGIHVCRVVAYRIRSASEIYGEVKFAVLIRLAVSVVHGDVNALLHRTDVEIKGNDKLFFCLIPHEESTFVGLVDCGG